MKFFGISQNSMWAGTINCESALPGLIFFKAEHGAVNRQSYLDTGYFSAIAAV